MVVYTLEQRWAEWAWDRLTEDAEFGKELFLSFRRMNMNNAGLSVLVIVL